MKPDGSKAFNPRAKMHRSLVRRLCSLRSTWRIAADQFLMSPLLSSRHVIDIGPHHALKQGKFRPTIGRDLCFRRGKLCSNVMSIGLGNARLNEPLDFRQRIAAAQDHSPLVSIAPKKSAPPSIGLRPARNGIVPGYHDGIGFNFAVRSIPSRSDQRSNIIVIACRECNVRKVDGAGERHPRTRNKRR